MVLMILKFLRWKKPLFLKLIRYIQQHFSYSNTDPDTVLHNIPNHQSLDDIANEFAAHDAERTNLRTNSTRINHQILAFHHIDKHFLENKEVREKIARKYIELIANDGIVFGRWHSTDDQGNPTHTHLHLCISATTLGNQKVIHLNNRKFNALRRNMERWMMMELPQLSASIVFINKPEEMQIDFEKRDKNRRKEREYLMKKRTNGIPTEKELLLQRLDALISKSYSKEDLFDQILQEPDLELYGYDGKPPVGVEVLNGRKYRFSTLKIEQRILELQNKEQQIIKERMAQLETLRNRHKSRDKSIFLER